MNAQDLIDQLNEIAKQHNVSLSELDVNFRQDFNSDVIDINYITEDLYDPETNSVLKSVTLFEDDLGMEDED